MRGGARALNLSRGPARVHITHGGPGPFARKNRDCCRFIPDIYLIGPGFYVSDCTRPPAPGGGAAAAKAVCFRAERPDAIACARNAGSSCETKWPNLGFLKGVQDVVFLV